MPKCADCVYCLNFNPDQFSDPATKYEMKAKFLAIGIRGDCYVCDILLNNPYVGAYGSIIDIEKEACSNFEKKPTSSSNDKGCCYVATAVYGDYNAPQVMVLRNYRDETLSKSQFGRAFIKTYYFLSPPFANWLKEAKRTNKMIKNILDRIVKRLQSKK